MRSSISRWAGAVVPELAPVGVIVVGSGEGLNAAFRPGAGHVARGRRRIRPVRAPASYRVHVTAGRRARRFGTLGAGVAVLHAAPR